jgi:hypothetical protein
MSIYACISPHFPGMIIGSVGIKVDTAALYCKRAVRLNAVSNFVRPRLRNQQGPGDRFGHERLHPVPVN